MKNIRQKIFANSIETKEFEGKKREIFLFLPKFDGKHNQDKETQSVPLRTLDFGYIAHINLLFILTTEEITMSEQS